MRELKKISPGIWLAVMVAALGYFVDIYDLLLFSIVRVASLRSVGVAEGDLMKTGMLLINAQMAGLLIGGLLWGALGDKRGRLSVLFGSIFLYSAANIANAFVQSVPQYAVLRFIAGVGLAGELGAGITLIAEILPTQLRGYGTTVVASVGILGAVLGGLVGDAFSWRASYALGGFMGILILLLRVGVRESGLYTKMTKGATTRGSFSLIFGRKDLLKRYIAIVFVGVPVWFVVGVLMTFTPEFAAAFHMTEMPTAGAAIMYCYGGVAIGDFFVGLLSQYLQSRKKVIGGCLAINAIVVVLHLLFARQTLFIYYVSCFVLGFSTGFWGMFVTLAAEQFGTNVRSTVTTSVPNLVRGSVIPITLLFHSFIPALGVIGSGALVGGICLTVAMCSLCLLKESFHRDLDYLEDHSPRSRA